MDSLTTLQDDNCGITPEWKPQIGMEFNSETEAYEFYNSYGVRMGFSVRREYRNLSKKNRTVLTSRRFVCNKQGTRRKDKRDVNVKSPRAETRTFCLAKMGVMLLDSGKYQCHCFVEEHNHPLTFPGNLYDLMSMQMDGRENHGFDQNYLLSKRQHGMACGEASILLQYFEEKSLESPSFYYSLQLDNNEHITNIFWADAKMIIDYMHFGDVITFDTTYCLNKEYRPLGIFVGLNHHKQVIFFGAALLYDQTMESFKWLFSTFLKVHGQKKPITIFTNQDPNIGMAISEVIPETWHGLCAWNIMQTGRKHLGDLMQDGSCFLKDLKACMFHLEEESDFDQAWEKLRYDYPIECPSLLDSLYEVKEKWAKCYVKKTFTIGMQSTELSESLYKELKNFVQSTFHIMQFFKHFERMINDKRYDEVQTEIDSRNKQLGNRFPKSPIIRHAGRTYTPIIFNAFQDEYDWTTAAYIKFRDESQPLYEYVVGIVDEEGDVKIKVSPSTHVVECTCRKFETFGILCCHALKIFDILDIKSIPDMFVLKRWTLKARDSMVQNIGKENEDTELDVAERFKVLCSLYVRIATKAGDSVEGYDLAKKMGDDMLKQLENLNVQ